LCGILKIGEGKEMLQKESSERRKFTRFEVNIPVACRPIARGRKRGGRELVYATIKNISSNGVLLGWPAESKVPDFLKLAIKILPISEEIECITRRVWVKQTKPHVKGKEGNPGRYDVGSSFVKDEYSEVPRLLSRETNFYWQIFERTGYVEAYLLHRGISKECEGVSDDGKDA
jgi:hypothetical protein